MFYARAVFKSTFKYCFYRFQKRFHLRPCADGNAVVLLDSFLIKMAHEDTAGAQCGIDLRAALFGVAHKEEVAEGEAEE